MKIISRKTGTLVLCLLLFLQVNSQDNNWQTGYSMDGSYYYMYQPISDSEIFLKQVCCKNPSIVRVRISVDGKADTLIGTLSPLAEGIKCSNNVKIIFPTGNNVLLWRSGDTADEWKAIHSEEDNNKKKAKENAKVVSDDVAGVKIKILESIHFAKDLISEATELPFSKELSDEIKFLRSKQCEITDETLVSEIEKVIKEYESKEQSLSNKNSDGTEISNTKSIPVDSIVSMFKKTLENDTSFYSSKFVQVLNDEMGKHLEVMNYVKNKDDREAYIQEQGLQRYCKNIDSMILSMKSCKDVFVDNFIKTISKGNKLPDSSEYKKRLKNILEERISERKTKLDDFRSKIFDEQTIAKRLFSGESIVINVMVILLVICLSILIIRSIKRANKKKKASNDQAEIIKQNAQTDIVVRRKATSILKKQNLEDVQQNDAYLQIDCMDFCSDSAVKRIYLKNTCIKDIYNLYAEDLRNPDNPNEDGCMVLGRWVYDEQNDEYYVSLEEIVKPGDDAIFKEYELNFGGKIKLKVSEKLRKLRRETNLQYDMTCWVHSHPGLGVFFSNADSSVQMQLKHPTHPKFLVAIVIDILTPEQELGIFTFKHDLSINSKADLKRMYSLEELHKWAVESDRILFKPEDHRNIMQKATKHIESHYGIEVPNGAIIDMCQLQTTQENGLLAWVHGYIYEKSGKTEYVLASVSQEKRIPDNEMLGCYINGTHCSIPTIKRMVSNDFSKMKFILFYSTSEDILTSIPIVDGQISMDETCYGEEKLEDLKIWTRRKR